MNPRFLGRDPKTVEQDLAILRRDLAPGLEAAQALWAELSAIVRDGSASGYTRRRAKQAADALGSLLDDLAADTDAETPFSWNDAAPKGSTE